VGFGLGIGTRIRKSAFFDATVAAGVTHFTTYNHMLMPVSYGDTVAEYWALVEGVVMWDVACQRQVQLSGPDASVLAQAVVCRDLSGADVGQGRYTPMVDHSGRLMNDPVTLRVDGERWWISLADSDMLFWCRAIAAERGLAVEVVEPDVSPLAVQGPRAEDVVADLFGEWIRDIRFFRYEPTEVEGIPIQLGRAGWSKQGGFELYLLDGSRGTELWNLVAEAGAPHGICPGTPNYMERIESALLSYRGDTLDDSDPFEARLEPFVDLDSDVDFIGREALIALRERGLRRQLVGIMIEGGPIEGPQHPWPVRHRDALVGSVRAAARSPRLDRNIGLAIVDVPANALGTDLVVQSQHGRRGAIVVDLPFIGR
jgi:glycine cleavage system aminomethyltransferase T